MIIILIIEIVKKQMCSKKKYDWAIWLIIKSNTIQEDPLMNEYCLKVVHVHDQNLHRALLNVYRRKIWKARNVKFDCFHKVAYFSSGPDGYPRVLDYSTFEFTTPTLLEKFYYSIE